MLSPPAPAARRRRHAHGALPGRAGRARLPQALLPRGRTCPVERLALAGALAHPHARRARAHLRAVRRRARRGGPASGLAAARHHALLCEPDGARGRAGAAPAHPHPGRHRISKDARRGRRSARRGRPYRGTWSRAPLSGPRAVPGHRLLLDLLPLLHALAHGRRGERRLFLQPAAMGGGARLHRRASPDPRRADLRRRSADALRRAARLSARALARHQACRVRAARHQGAGGAADAGYPRADPRSSRSIIRCG